MFRKTEITRLLQTITIVALVFLTQCNSPVNIDHQRTEANIKASIQEAVASHKVISNKHVPTTQAIKKMADYLLATHEKRPLVYETPFDITANNMPIGDFVMQLIPLSRYDIITKGALQGNITMSLKHASTPQVMDYLEHTYGFDVNHVNEHVYVIAPKTMKTQIFHINHINIERSGSSKVNIEANNIENNASSTNKSTASNSSSSSEIQTTFDTSFWSSLETSLKALIKQDEQISKARSKNKKTELTNEIPTLSINRQTGVVVVTAYPKTLKEINALISQVNKVSGKQVIVEAKILEIELNHTFQQGINWKLMGAELINNSSTGVLSNIDNIAQYFQLHASGKKNDIDFDSTIKLLAQQGKVSVISSPRIATLNNQKAIIKVGVDAYYSTGPTSNTTSSSSSSTQNYSFNYRPYFSGVALDVTPFIHQNMVTLHIHPMISRIDTDTKQIPLNNTSSTTPIDFAKQSVRESDSIIKSKTGQIIIIGGLLETINNTKHTHIPLTSERLGDQDDVSKKIELVILLKPTIIEDTQDWQTALTRWQKDTENVRRPLYE